MQYPVTVVASRPLSKQEHTTYLTMSTSSCQGLIENALSLSSLAATTTRHCATTSRDATIHRGRDCVDPSLPALCAVTKIEATLPSIAAQYTLGTLSDKLAHNLTDDVAMVNQKLAKLGSHVLARQQLYCLGGTTTDMPYHYAGIVWYAHSSLPLCASRDFCVLEYHNQVEVMDWQSKRRRGWIRCLQSVDVIGCPSLRASRGHIRSSMFRSGQLFVETDCPGMLTVYSVAVHHYNGLLPPGGAAKLMRREVATILKLEKAMATQRVLQRLRTVEPKQLQTATFRATRVHCPQCHRSRSWFRHQRACAICGEAVCASCGREWSVPGVTPAAFVCLHCFCPKDSERTSSYVRSTYSSTNSTPRSMALSCSDAQKEMLKQLASPTHSDSDVRSELSSWLFSGTDNSELAHVMHDLQRTLEQFETANTLPKALERLAWAHGL